MSAPETTDPLVVNTKDACWVRRAVTSDGRGLYAVEGSCRCPEFLLVPLVELAAVGIVGSADVLPAPGPDAVTVQSVEPPLKGRARLDASAAAAAEATHWKRLGIEDPHDSPLHHDYRLGRDLPEMGGV